MKVRAPGKLVVSGAYAVLEGAPAIVAAVDRFVVADASRPAPMITPEVRAALGEAAAARAPFFDASALRARDAATGEERKLGLGSSAAIVVASLGAIEVAASGALSDAELSARVLPRALEAHRAAQGGGSGIDVVASAVGGFVRCRRVDARLEHGAHAIPSGVTLRAFASASARSTPEMIARVRALATRDAAAHARVFAALRDASERCAAAADAASFVAAIGAFADALSLLGAASESPIVPREIASIDRRARAAGGVLYPSGAGGGDVVLHVGTSAPSAEIEALARSAGLVPLALAFGARGLHVAPATHESTP